MSDKHTPLPWYAESTSVAEMYEIKYDGRSLATAFSNPYIPSNAKQDAEFIVTACNNHEVLVNRLRNLVNAESCRNCEDQGFYIIASNDGEPEQCQCKFCYTSPNSMFNRIAEAKQLLEQIGE